MVLVGHAWYPYPSLLYARIWRLTRVFIALRKAYKSPLYFLKNSSSRGRHVPVVDIIRSQNSCVVWQQGLQVMDHQDVSIGDTLEENGPIREIHSQPFTCARKLLFWRRTNAAYPRLHATFSIFLPSPIVSSRCKDLTVIDTKNGSVCWVQSL